jgi:glycosyltransferase involved in cell wall biosynthesis
MRTVAQICFSKAWGGLEMSSVKMTRLFREAGYNSIGICQPRCHIHKGMQAADLKCLTTPMRDYFSPSASLKLSGWIRKHKIEAIYLHMLRDLWIVYPALLNHPEVKLFGFARMFLRNIEKKDFLHRMLYSRMDKLIALSRSQQGHLLHCLPVPENKYIVIPNGVDTERFQPRPPDSFLRQLWGCKPDDKVVGFIGRLDPQKGCLEFVEAAGIVSKKFSNVRFVMVGAETIGDSPFANQVHRRISDLGLQSKIAMTPFQKEVDKVMNSLDIFTMPSYEENFANVLLEGLASGKVCIGTNAGGTPEMLTFGESGLLVEPKSSRSLAESIERVLADPSLGKLLEQKARQKALGEYDMQKVFRRIESLAFANPRN